MFCSNSNKILTDEINDINLKKENDDINIKPTKSLNLIENKQNNNNNYNYNES